MRIERRVLVPHVLEAATPLPGGVVHALDGNTMGTTWSVRFAALKSIDDTIVRRGIERRLAEVIEQMSTWEPDSALCRYNAADAGSWHPMPSGFMTVLACALHVAKASGGAFDPTCGAVVNAWGFGPTHRFDEADFAPPALLHVNAMRAAARATWSDVKVDRTAGRVLQPGGITLDFSGIAKGFAVDHVTHHLHELGLRDTLVEIGGELRGEGIRPDGQPWWVALEEPDVRGTSPPTVLALHGLSVATSGDYRRFHMQGSTRFSHTIDPRTGAPISHALASVTVLHRECMLADAWATALGVMGSDAGLGFANEHGIAARFVDRDTSDPLEERFSERLSAPLQELLH